MRSLRVMLAVAGATLGLLVFIPLVNSAERDDGEAKSGGELRVEIRDEGGRITVTTYEGELRMKAGPDARTLEIRDDRNQSFTSFSYRKLREATESLEGSPLVVGDLLVVRLASQAVEIRRRVTAPGEWSPGEVQRFSHDSFVYSVAFSSDGWRVLSSGFDLTLRLWDIESGKLLHKFQGQKAYELVNAVAFSPDGRSALLGCGQYRGTGRLKLWDVEAWKEIAEFDPPDGIVGSVAFSPDGKFALSGGRSGKVEYWDVATGRSVRRYETGLRSVASVCFAPTGRLAAYAGGAGGPAPHTGVWDVQTGEKVRTFDEPRVPSCVAFLPDGNRLVSGGADGTIVLWDVDAGKLRRRFNTSCVVVCLAVLPDGHRMLSGGNDGVVRLWSLDTGREILKFQGHTDRVTTLAVSRQGQRAASGGYDRTVRVWALPPEP